MFTWDMDPVLFDFGAIQIRYYGVLFASAFLSGLFLLRRFMIEKGQDGNLADSLLTYLVIGIVVGARLIHVMFYGTEYYLNNPSEILKIWHGGVASHGGVLGAIIASYLFARKYKMDVWDVLDSVSVQFLLVAGFIRIGNFFNSEIVGRITEVPWAVKFLRYDHHWRHPSQLYELSYHILGYAMVALIYKKYRSGLKTGMLLFIVINWYFAARFVTEFFKEYQTLTSGLTMGQWLSLPFVIVGVVLLYWRSKTQTLVPSPAGHKDHKGSAKINPALTEETEDKEEREKRSSNRKNRKKK